MTRSVPFAALASLALGTCLVAQVPEGSAYVAGFPLPGEPAFPGLIERSTGAFTPLEGLSTETRSLNAAWVDRASGQLVVSGIQSGELGAEGPLVELRVGAGAVLAERVLSGGLAPVRALAQTGDGDFLVAGPDGVELRRRSDGCPCARFDLPGLDWNAVAVRPEQDLAYALSFGDGGEVWELELSTRAVRRLLRFADGGWPETLTGAWVDPADPNAPLWVSSLEARAPLVRVDTNRLLLAPAPAAPPSGLNAIAGDGAGSLWLLGAGNPSSALWRLDLASGALDARHTPSAPWSSAALALPPPRGSAFAFPRSVPLGAPLVSEIATYGPPGAFAAIFLVAVRYQGQDLAVGLPLTTAALGPDGGLRLRLDFLPRELGGFLPGDGFLFQTFWLEPPGTTPGFGAARWLNVR